MEDAEISVGYTKEGEVLLVVERPSILLPLDTAKILVKELIRAIEAAAKAEDVTPKLPTGLKKDGLH